MSRHRKTLPHQVLGDFTIDDPEVDSQLNALCRSPISKLRKLNELLHLDHSHPAYDLFKEFQNELYTWSTTAMFVRRALARYLNQQVTPPSAPAPADVTMEVEKIVVETQTVATQTEPPSTATASTAEIASQKNSNTSSWAGIALEAHQKRTPPSERKFQAALRVFQEPDPSAPKGFGYLYLTRSVRLARSEIRRRLRTIGLDTSRILDISYPTAKHMGLLVHAGYAQTVIDRFAAYNVKVTTNLDPTAAEHLQDPKFQGMPPEERAATALRLHSNRCLAALRRLRYHLVPAVGKSFVENGWISEEMVSELLAELKPASALYKKRAPSSSRAVSDAFAGFGADPAPASDPLDVSMADGVEA